MRTSSGVRTVLVLAAVASLAAAGCGRNNPPVARPTPPPPTVADTTPVRPPDPPTPVPEPVVPRDPVGADNITSTSLDELNRNSPLKPVYFALDSSEIDTTGRSALSDNAAVLKTNPTWTITIEGHCDERGTAEYNLALGERRAVAARTYLVSLGIAADRLRTVSYGKEFPFEAGHDEAAWSRNRRAHFVITAR